MTPTSRDIIAALVAKALKSTRDDEPEPLDPTTRELLQAAMRQHPELARALTEQEAP